MAAAASMDMALDDVIALSSKDKRSRVTGPTDNRRGAFRARRQTRPVSSGDVNSAWKHDLFSEDAQNEGSGNDKGDRRTHQASGSRRPIAERLSSHRTGARNNDRYDGDKYREHRHATRLIVKNLFYEVSEDDLKELFSTVSTVSKVILKYDAAGRSLGEATVYIESMDDAKKAMADMDGAELDGQKISIDFLPPPVDRHREPPPHRSVYERTSRIDHHSQKPYQRSRH